MRPAFRAQYGIARTGDDNHSLRCYASELPFSIYVWFVMCMCDCIQTQQTGRIVNKMKGSVLITDFLIIWIPSPAYFPIHFYATNCYRIVCVESHSMHVWQYWGYYHTQIPLRFFSPSLSLIRSHNDRMTSNPIHFLLETHCLWSFITVSFAFNFQINLNRLMNSNEKRFNKNRKLERSKMDENCWIKWHFQAICFEHFWRYCWRLDGRYKITFVHSNRRQI